MSKFYDTNCLIDYIEDIIKENEHFYISSITLNELEHIKSSAKADDSLKRKARKAVRLLTENMGLYTVITYSSEIAKYDDAPPSQYGEDNNDAKILRTVVYASDMYEYVTFVTSDLLCYLLAKNIEGIGVEFPQFSNKSDYTGYKILKPTEEELSALVEEVERNGCIENKYNLLINQYVIIEYNEEYPYVFKCTGDKCIGVDRITFKSTMFDKVTPKKDDVFQRIAMDSLQNNQFTVLRGPAGSGKSYLALGYLFSLLEKGKIDKIIIFCNTCATRDSCKLGFYPGTKDDKLLDSQMGHFLTGKLGDISAVERLISEGKLELVPTADCRGMDTSGKNAGIYFTEAQNTTVDMMKLILQRIGEDSVCIFEGDDKAQTDMSIYEGDNNGLSRISEVFRGESYYGEVTLQNCYRSAIAKRAELM